MLIIKLLFIIFFTQVICYEMVYYKKNLRGLYEKEINTIIQQIIENEYKYIYETVINYAKVGFNELNFTIFDGCINDYGSNMISKIKKQNHILGTGTVIGGQLPDNMLKHIFNILSKDNFTSKVLDKFNQVFPDSNITYNQYVNPDQCNYYRLSW
jgi:hypothetical protein